MKKIIYSLVIMIAAGSLFTSCIDYVEPVGIQELRLAKADYLDALSQLRLADADLQKANAVRVLAEAALIQENANFRAVEVKIKELEYELTKAQNQLEIDSLTLEINNMKERQAAALAQAKQARAEAEEALRVALAKIEVAKMRLTPEEAALLTTVISEYKAKLAAYDTAVEGVTAAEAALWAAKYSLNDSIDWKAKYTADMNDAADELAYWQAYLASITKDADMEQWNKELKKYQDSMDKLNYNKYQITQDSVFYMVNTFCEGFESYKAEVEAAEAALPAKGKTIDIGTIKNNYTFDKKLFAVPLFARFLAYAYPYTTYASVEGSAWNKTVPLDFHFVDAVVGTESDTLKIHAQYADKAYVLAGGSKKVREVSTGDTIAAPVVVANGLETIVATLEREWVAANAATNIEALKKAADKAKKDYEDTRALMEDNSIIKANTAAAKKALVDAIDQLIFAANDYKLGYVGGAASKADSLSLYNALVGFAKAKLAYIGKAAAAHDSITYKEITVKTTFVGDLVIGGFTQAKFSGTDGGADFRARSAYGDVDPWLGYQIANDGNGGNYWTLPSDPDNDAFVKVLRSMTDGTWTDYSMDLTVGQLYFNGLTYDEDAPTLFTDPAFVPATEIEYQKAVCAFWGKTFSPANYNTVKSLPLNFSVETFTQPDMAVFFDGANVIYTEKLGIILENLQKGVTGFNNDFNDFGTPNVDPAKSYFVGSMLFDYFKAQQAYEDVANQSTNKELLEALRAFVDQLAVDFDALETARKAAQDKEDVKTAAYNEAMIALTGKKDGVIVKTEIAFNAAIKDGAYTLKGKQLEIANKYLKDYPAAKKDWEDRLDKVNHTIGHLVSIKTALDDAYTAAANVSGYTGADFEAVYQDYKTAFNAYVIGIVANINNAEKAYQDAKRLLAQYEAGYDPIQTAIEVAENNLTEAQAALATAEKELALAKAEYDAAVAKLIK
ncbi:MAG: hypothetical protein PHD11_00345 [Bacteroidales bacterium]|nr:hypothetical protein [Bacteroidales bacterium]